MPQSGARSPGLAGREEVVRNRRLLWLGFSLPCEVVPIGERIVGVSGDVAAEGFGLRCHE